MNSIHRLFCLWLYGYADKLDPLSGALSALGDRLSVLGVCVGCIVTQMNRTHGPSSSIIFSPQLVVAFMAGVLMLDISSYWMHICAQVGNV